MYTHTPRQDNGKFKSYEDIINEKTNDADTRGKAIGIIISMLTVATVKIVQQTVSDINKPRTIRPRNYNVIDYGPRI